MNMDNTLYRMSGGVREYSFDCWKQDTPSVFRQAYKKGKKWAVSLHEAWEDIKDQRVGENMHPMHPWCRCTSKPYMDGYDTGRMQRAAMREDGTIEKVPASMTYAEWETWQKEKRPVAAKKWLTAARDIGTIKGRQIARLSDHMLGRMQERGVALDEVVDAINNPLFIKPEKKDAKGQSSFQVIGRNATVAVSCDTWAITTAWKTSTKLREKYGGNGK